MLSRSRFGVLGALTAALLYGFPGAPMHRISGYVSGAAMRMRRPPVAIHRPPPRLNRSRHWAYAETYKDARRISPFPTMPVR
jgi:hypothetical protein